MSQDLLDAFKDITGCLTSTIFEYCDSLYPLDPETILDFHIHYNRWPTESEACLILDIGLVNFNFLIAEGIIAA